MEGGVTLGRGRKTITYFALKVFGRKINLFLLDENLFSKTRRKQAMLRRKNLKCKLASELNPRGRIECMQRDPRSRSYLYCCLQVGQTMFLSARQAGRTELENENESAAASKTGIEDHPLFFFSMAIASRILCSWAPPFLGSSFHLRLATADEQAAPCSLAR